MMLRKGRKCYKEENEDKFRLLSIREKESNEMIRQEDINIMGHVEAAKSLNDNITSLEDKIAKMMIVIESKTPEQVQQIKHFFSGYFALMHCRDKGLQIYNFNFERLDSTSRLNVESV